MPNSTSVSKGQAALVALLTGHISASGEMDRISEVLQMKNLSLAGLDDVYASRFFLERAQEILDSYSTAPRQARSSSQTDQGRSVVGNTPGAEIIPRVKPQIDG